MSQPEKATEPSPPAPVPLRRNRNFQLLWTGQVLSDLGTEMGTIAYPLLILALTHSPVIAGAAGTVTSIAAFVTRLPAGSLSDRLDRRRTMIACDGVRFLALAALAAGVLLHVVSWPVVLGVAIVDRVGDTIFTPSSTAVLPTIVADKQLESAWAATEGRQYGASLAGPALGGLLFGVGRAVPFMGDAVSYAISSFTSGGMRGSFRPKTAVERKGLWAEAIDSIRLFWKDGILRAVVTLAPLINFAFTGVFFTVILGLRRHGVTPTVIGLVQAGIMVGGLLGALAAPRLQSRLTLRRLVIVLTAVGTLSFAAAALLMPSPLVGLPIAVPLFLSPTANAALVAAMMRRAPEEMRGRVMNGFLQLATGLATLAPLVSGFLVARVSSRWAMGAFAVALAISAVLAISLKSLRDADASLAR